MNNLDFIEVLVTIQRREDLSDEVMAGKVGCARQLYHATRTGKVPLGWTVFKGACRAFPLELCEHALIFLTGDADILTKLADGSANAHQTSPGGRTDGFRQRLREFLARVFPSNRTKP